jgi:uncharacterized protein with von Willebrand factor type A (vWA) domain
MLYRYSRWDGSQALESLSADELMEHVARELLDDNDLRSILRRMTQRGAQLPSGRRQMGLQDLLERLRANREQRLSRFNLNSILDDVRERLERVVQTEREGIQRRLEQVGGTADRRDTDGRPRTADRRGRGTARRGEESSPLPLGEGQGEGTPGAGAGTQAEGVPGGGAGKQGEDGPGAPRRDAPPIGAHSESENASDASREQDAAGSTESPGGAPNQRLREMLERMARQRLDTLDRLPPDVGGRIQQLRDYEFMDQEARQQFQEILDLLQKQVAQSYFQGLQQSIQSMTPEALRQVHEMVKDLNRLMQQRLKGEPTDFEFREFMNKWGQFFPKDIQNVDQLAEHMQQQIAQMESLLNSMSPEQRRELEAMLDALFQDGQFQWEMAQLAHNLERLRPRGAQSDVFPFAGDEPLSLQEALQLMGEMNGLDELERELLQAARSNDASQVDADRLGRLIGEEARRMLEDLQQLTRMLEEAGLIRRRGNDWELTPLAMRKIGQRALEEVFRKLKLNTFGEHSQDRKGVGLERLDEVRPYTFGDPFLVDVQRSVMNALFRQGPGTPVRLRPQDFETYRTTNLTRCSTVILLDMSYSMMMGGRFNAGRKVALALDSLIRAQFPRDTLYVAAFSYFVLPLKPEMLFDSYWVEYGRGTNFQEALRQARLMLQPHKGGTRQILMVTDGEPTTYSYWSGDGDHQGMQRYHYGPVEEALREVLRCTREDIHLNIFMLDQSPGLTHFVQTMAKLNRGRAFYSSPDRLGQYVLMDYVSNRRKHLS